MASPRTGTNMQMSIRSQGRHNIRKDESGSIEEDIYSEDFERESNRGGAAVITS